MEAALLTSAPLPFKATSLLFSPHKIASFQFSQKLNASIALRRNRTRPPLKVSASSQTETIVTEGSTTPLKMKAWVYDEYGDANVLKFDEGVSVPEVKEDQVLVKGAAAALNLCGFQEEAGEV